MSRQKDIKTSNKPSGKRHSHKKMTKDKNASFNKKKYVFAFGRKTEGNAQMRELLGGKGANLAEMASIGLPVPPGFTISTEVCSYYYHNSRRYPNSLAHSTSAAIKEIESQLGKQFGNRENPLLVSVRSGARDSMPGMMDTILNLGLNDDCLLYTSDAADE